MSSLIGAVIGDCRVREKELTNIEKYQNLKRELKRLCLLKTVEIVPAVVGAPGSLVVRSGTNVASLLPFYLLYKVFPICLHYT